MELFGLHSPKIPHCDIICGSPILYPRNNGLSCYARQQGGDWHNWHVVNDVKNTMFSLRILDKAMPRTFPNSSRK